MATEHRLQSLRSSGQWVTLIGALARTVAVRKHTMLQCRYQGGHLCSAICREERRRAAQSACWRESKRDMFGWGKFRITVEWEGITTSTHPNLSFRNCVRENMFLLHYIQ